MALFKKGLNFFRGAKYMNVTRSWDARMRFIILESLFTRLNDQKIASRYIKSFWEEKDFFNKFLYLAVLLRNEHLYLALLKLL